MSSSTAKHLKQALESALLETERLILEVRGSGEGHIQTVELADMTAALVNFNAALRETLS